MATSFVITPSTGQGALFTQAGAGASPGYGAIDLRRAAFANVAQEGVMAAGSFEVTQKSAGANLSVDVAANVADGQGSGIAAVVQGDSITAQGLYPCPPHSGVGNVDIATANGSNPRVDRVVLEIQDNTHDSSGQNRFQVRVISGTASSGATLDNLTGAASVPVNCLLLADVLVPATDTTISNNQIRDRRKWARGADVFKEGSGPNDVGSSSTSLAAFPAAIAQFRVETSGCPVEIIIAGRAAAASATESAIIAAWVDGASQGDVRVQSDEANDDDSFVLHRVLTSLAAGSHTFEIALATTNVASTATLRNQSNVWPRMIVRELVRQNTANNITTSG